MNNNLFTLLLVVLLSSSGWAKSYKIKDPLILAQKIASDAMRVNAEMLKIETQNTAHSNTANYIPRSLHAKTIKNSAGKVGSVAIGKVVKHNKKTKLVYNPEHPLSDKDGMVRMPDIDPLISMMNLHKAREDNARMMRVHEIATRLTQQTAQLMNK